MKTKELIEQLQKADPSGDCEVVADGTPIYFVAKLPAYYDGPLAILIHDEKLKDKCYSITGYKLTCTGEKIRLHLTDLESVIFEDSEATVDLSELPESQKNRWEKLIQDLRKESRKIDEEIVKWKLKE
ncbi:MAG TPA: hypothetical protein VKN14_07155 [Flavobacteriaceae bacterium]|nr:hypothetical protein [Flavobacteriaceae bacterium]